MINQPIMVKSSGGSAVSKLKLYVWHWSSSSRTVKIGDRSYTFTDNGAISPYVGVTDEYPYKPGEEIVIGDSNAPRTSTSVKAEIDGDVLKITVNGDCNSGAIKE